MESPEDKHTAGSVVRLPGIREDATPSTPAHVEQIQQEFVYSGISLVGAPATPSSTAPPITPPSTTISSLSTPLESLTSNTKMSLHTPNTPRIDISRASSSSQHEDSRDSTPERELFDQGNDGTGTKLGLAFKEEGTLDLRSSTEELDFQDPQDKLRPQKARPQSPCPLDDSLCQRKDSQSSEIGLLSISGRTSRLSSIGSQGSAQSRISNVSHLSIISGQSGRSPSPHKMLLETSFCGNKTPTSAQQNVEQAKIDSDVLERVLLSRKHDPREAILAEGISVQIKPKEKMPIKIKPPEITIKVDKPTNESSNHEKVKLPRTFVSPSGVEYIYIPLKGPLPKDENSRKANLTEAKSLTHSKSPAQNSKKNVEDLGKSRSKSASSSPSVQKTKSMSLQNEEPKYIRIKLKPDHMYDDSTTTLPEVKKPICLDLNETTKKPFQSFSQVITEAPTQSQSKTPSASPKPVRHKGLHDTHIGSKTPSPSLSRRSSFTSLFKSRETIVSPESPTVAGLKRKNTLTGILKDASDNIREKTRSRSKSRERDKSSVSTAPSSTESIDSKSKQQKSVLSIFKPKKGSTKQKSALDSSSPEVLSSLDVEFQFKTDPTSMPIKKYYETPLQGESIRIPLHSPTHYDDRTILQDLKSSSQDSQETVIDTTKSVDAIIETIPSSLENSTTIPNSIAARQSSTSSENVVFSTKLGSTNDLFSTKLSKDHVKKNQRSMDKSATFEELSKPIDQLNKIPKAESFTTTKNVKDEAPIGDQIKPKENGRALRNLSHEDRCSSESERDSELDYLKNKKEPEEKTEVVEPERKGLVYQQDSFEDELPYVPTTLPQERSVAIPIVPVKQRGTFEMKTYPIERPRSTTPINLSTLEDYCEDVVSSVNNENITKAIEKLKISLPRDESTDRVSKAKSPRKPSTNANWFSFAEKSSTQKTSPPDQESKPPPLPPKGVQKEWINFEEIPERRKPPRRIQTIPSRGNIEVSESILQENIIYSYANPEDCKCECHEIAREREQQARQQQETDGGILEDEVPLLEDDPGEEEKSTHDPVERIKVDLLMSDRRSIIR